MGLYEEGSSLARERDRAIEDLRALYCAEVVDLDAFSERVDRVLAAGSVAEATAALDDLPAAAEVVAERLAASGELGRCLIPHLLAGERLLWVGQPDPSRLFTAADLVLVLSDTLGGDGWGGQRQRAW
ncbi:MAG: hypothetical protein ACYDHH_11720 [Solirubrobacteraceae bacterium]